jgi:hypothetical protein
MSSENPKDVAVHTGSDTDRPINDVAPSTEQAVESEDVAPRKNVSKFTRVYRSPLFNVIIVGLISFTQPGIWNALNSESFYHV